MNLILPPPISDFPPSIKLPDETFYMQPKLNGISAIFHYDYFYTRTGKTWHPQITEQLVEELDKLHASNIGLYIFGEFYVHGWPLQKIQRAIAVNRNTRNSLTKEIEFHVYDCLFEDCKEANFYLRYNKLLFAKTKIGRRTLGEISKSQIKFVGASLTDNGCHEQIYQEYLKQDFEGAIYRLHQEVYKRKAFKDAEFVCVGMKEGLGRNRGKLGSLQLQTKEGREFSVGTGFSDRQRKELCGKLGILGKMITIRYLTLSEDGIPLNTTFIGVRDYE